MSDRVLLVMDDAFALSTMAAALKLHGTNVIGEAQKKSSAILLMRSLQPNVLLIDMHLSDEHSIEIASAIRKDLLPLALSCLLLAPICDYLVKLLVTFLMGLRWLLKSQ